jgi:hypothetical protein
VSERLQPGEQGYWKVWGASPWHMREGDVLVFTDGFFLVTNTPEQNVTVMVWEQVQLPENFDQRERQLPEGKPQKVNVGLAYPKVAIMRWGTGNTLAE